jgi:acetoin utilization protein AcuB
MTCPKRRAETKRETLRRLAPEGRSDATPEITVGHIMTPDPVCVQPTKAAIDLVELFYQAKFHHLLVTDSGRLVGVISDRDVVRLFSLNDTADGDDLNAVAVGDLMSLNLVTVTPQTPLHDAVRLIIDHDVHCLPVVDDGQQVRGILTSTDLFVTLEHFLTPAHETAV